MLRNFVGQETFQIAVATYMKRLSVQTVIFSLYIIIILICTAFFLANFRVSTVNVLWRFWMKNFTKIVNLDGQ